MVAKYRRKYVAFVDLLGFSNLVLASGEREDAPQEIVQALDRFQNTATASPDDDLQISQFSDCLVLSTNADPDGLLALFSALKAIADNLLQADLLVRGAVTVGPFVHEENVVFGPPLIEAYKMESETVSLPMIEFSRAVMEDVVKLPNDIDQIIAFRFRERPEHYYLHYLLDWSYYDGVPRNGRVVLDEPGRLVRHYIAKRLATHTGSVREKAEWLKRYWSAAVADAGYFPEVDEEADLPYPEGAQPFRTRIMKIARGDTA